MEIKRIGVVGAGAMGSGIAHTAAQAGFAVVLRDVERERGERAIAQMDGLMQRAVSKGRMTDEQRQATLSRLTPTADWEPLAESDLVIEAVFEDLAVKQEVFRQLDQVCPPDAILASNTSSMSITALAAATRRPEQVCGMHFFNPVQVMRLLEVVRGYQTSDRTVAAARQVGEAMGKTVIEVKKDTPGFVVNRILMPMLIEAARVVEEGIATVEEVDQAVKLGLNHPMGPFELLDFTGIDVCYNVVEYFWSELRESQYRPPHLLKSMVRAGRIGRKAGRGFYTYSNS